MWEFMSYSYKKDYSKGYVKRYFYPFKYLRKASEVIQVFVGYIAKL